MKAEIITIGTELLLGDVLDTNSAYLAHELKELGIHVYHMQTVGDNPIRLKEALTLAQKRSDFVFAVGGLGPTTDDITKDVLADLLGQPLIVDPPSLRKMESYFNKSGFQITPNNLKQVQIPQGTRPIPNPEGLATGVWSDHDSCITLLLPGPPREMKAMFRHHIKNQVKSPSHGVLYSHTYHFLGVGESHLDDALAPWIQGKNPSLAPYAKQGEVSLRLTARAKDEEEAEAMMAPADAAIRQQFGHALYGVDVPNLASALHEFLLRQELTIATAESCTGGLVAKSLTDQTGSSAYFMGGIVAYANKAKMDLLGVKDSILETYGAVSPETAIAMAKGAQKAFDTDIAISTTGVAGPGGGSEEKPVGTVYMGLITPQSEKAFKLIDLPQNYLTRTHIRHMTTQYALFHVLKSICNMSKA